jgi:hypothetical protein
VDSGAASDRYRRPDREEETDGMTGASLDPNSTQPVHPVSSRRHDPDPGAHFLAAAALSSSLAPARMPGSA